MTSGAACAHQRVVYKTIDEIEPRKVTRTTGRWECDSGCGTLFVPVNTLVMTAPTSREQEIRARWEAERAGFAALRELPLAKSDQEAGELIQMHDDIGFLLAENDLLRRQYKADGLELAAKSGRIDGKDVELAALREQVWAAEARADALAEEVARLKGETVD